MISHSERGNENENTEKIENAETVDKPFENKTKIDSVITVRLAEFLNHPSSVLSKYSKTHPIHCEVCKTGYFLVGFCLGRDHTKLVNDAKNVNHSKNCVTCKNKIDTTSKKTENLKNSLTLSDSRSAVAFSTVK